MMTARQLRLTLDTLSEPSPNLDFRAHRHHKNVLGAPAKAQFIPIAPPVPIPTFPIREFCHLFLAVGRSQNSRSSPPLVNSNDRRRVQLPRQRRGEVQD
jgi:hypothetical protein